ncbi:glycoside hydrolase [Mucilaginibacter sp. PPCGB 2223]|uniref:glycoside hydrolase family 88/105 protein n=1 Tax=Mucilaginibacter sp. PPCGB 2223 TaxID=1886027 RepID=UPI0008245AEC|nr:glycoside hydrolase family 88 protein [Mucilaginibacter sp. PPCGB 2223]OCX51563.1 glycoside hydrolase [Mucilaginibacter sp. PPCGB 2223]
MKNIQKLSIITFLFLSALTVSAFGANHKVRPADSVFNLMKKVADWQWNELETKGWKYPKTDWTNGVMYTGMTAWAKIAHNPVYFDKLLAVGKSINWQIGPNRSFADDYCIAQTYTQLYGIYKNPLYIADFKKMADSLVAAPHSEDLLWVKKIHLREWAWCDALYMGPAGLANLSAVTGDSKYLDEACKLWWKTSEYLYDKDERLFFRDSRYFTQKEKNDKKVFWSRGNGWVMGGLVNMLAKMPRNYPDRDKFIAEFKEMAEKIAILQQSDGTWHASLLDPSSYPSKETSGTGLFCYALAWGVNQKILPYNQYYPVISKAWAALTSSVHADGKLGYVQPIGASPDKVTADDTEVYGVGAFLLAGTQMLILQNSARR